MMIPIVALIATVSFAAPSVTASSTAYTLEAPIIANTPHDVEEYVREYFEDEPILAEIARCESTFRHLLPDGTLIRGKVNSRDIGVMQINTHYHGETAEKLGLDLTTLEGNLLYAKDLFERQGTQPWSASKPCWGKHADQTKLLAKN